MLDCHNHILFGVDDGCRDREESRALAEALKAVGHVGLVATPHIRPGIFDNDPDGLRRRRDETAPIVQEAGLELYLGAEYYFDEHFLARGLDRTLLTLGETSRYVLTELPRQELPLRWEEVVFEIRLRGYVPVIAHPERCRAVGEDLDRVLAQFAQGGVLLQLDLGSLVGHYGRKAQKLAQRIAKRGAYHLAAGDLHRPEDVEKIIIPAKAALCKLLGGQEDRVLALTERNPRLVVLDRPPEALTVQN